MIKKYGAIILFICLFCHLGFAQELPTVENISPGLDRFWENWQKGPFSRITFQLVPESVFRIRDISVMKEMFSGAEFIVEEGKNTGITGLQIIKNGAELLHLTWLNEEEQQYVCIDETSYRIDETSSLYLKNTVFSLPFQPFQRLQPKEIEEKINQSVLMQFLPENWQVGEIVWKETWSANQEKLIQLDVESQITDASGEEWKISGVIRRPNGKSPKDTTKIVVEKDAKNYLEINESITYSSTVTRKGKQGTVSATGRIKVNGKFNGYAVYLEVAIRFRNEWTEDGSTLNEKITLTLKPVWQDKTPGRELENLDLVEANLKQVIRVSSTELGECSEMQDVATLELKMDKTTTLAGSGDFHLQISKEPTMTALEIGKAEELTHVHEEELMQRKMLEIETELYRQLSPKTQKRILQ